MEQKPIYPKKQKKDSKKTYILRISVAVIRRFNVKKVSFIFKISPTTYLLIIEIDIK